MKAIEILQTNPNGFFLFVEGGRIDHALHANLAHIALEETAEFSRTVALATQMLSTNDTLFVVTADHAHTLSLGGYPVCEMRMPLEHFCDVNNLRAFFRLSFVKTTFIGFHLWIMTDFNTISHWMICDLVINYVCFVFYLFNL